MTGVGGHNNLGGSAKAGIRVFIAKMTVVSFGKTSNLFGSNILNLPILSPSALALPYPCLKAFINFLRPCEGATLVQPYVVKF